MRSETIDHDAVLAFLAELTALTRKHGIEIAGCGCCGSPYLWATDEEGHYKADEANGHWDCLEYVRPGEGAEQVVSPTELLRPLVNPVLLEPGESLAAAVEGAMDGDVIMILPGYSGKIVSDMRFSTGSGVVMPSEEVSLVPP